MFRNSKLFFNSENIKHFQSDLRPQDKPLRLIILVLIFPEDLIESRRQIMLYLSKCYLLVSSHPKTVDFTDIYVMLKFLSFEYQRYASGKNFHMP